MGNTHTRYSIPCLLVLIEGRGGCFQYRLFVCDFLWIIGIASLSLFGCLFQYRLLFVTWVDYYGITSLSLWMFVSVSYRSPVHELYSCHFNYRNYKVIIKKN